MPSIFEDSLHTFFTEGRSSIRFLTVFVKVLISFGTFTEEKEEGDERTTEEGVEM